MIIQTGLSTTRKSAQSKKCHLLDKLRTDKIHLKVALAIRAADPLLAQVCSIQDITDAANKLKPKKSRNNLITLNVNLDD